MGNFWLFYLVASFFSDWRCGGSEKLVDIIKTLTDEEKEHLRQQNGGLQTFIKNQHQVFTVKNIVWLQKRMCTFVLGKKWICWHKEMAIRKRGISIQAKGYKEKWMLVLSKSSWWLPCFYWKVCFQTLNIVSFILLRQKLWYI